MKYKSFSEMPRMDLRAIPELKAAGWNVKFHYNDKLNGRTTVENVPHNEVEFLKDPYVVRMSHDRKGGKTMKVWKRNDTIKMDDLGTATTAQEIIEIVEEDSLT